ncbi:hypothetical protein HYU22_03900 [Candidatus Woesearchaeota archaeon]|nr:hypothetical protein [Candidatus Woesearchaeota archaeon]
MKEVWEKIERFNSHLITPAIIVLLGIIIVELFVHPQNETVKIIIRVLDYLVIAVFVVDLTFLAIKARSTSFFFRHYWLDLLAIFPFSLLFSVVTRAYETVLAAERLALGQSIIHEGLEANKEIEALSKGNRAARIVRIASRLLRVIAKSRLFNMFSSKHQQARKKVFGKNDKSKKK